MRKTLAVMLLGCFVLSSCLSCDKKRDSSETSSSEESTTGCVQQITAAIGQKDYTQAISIYHLTVPPEKKKYVDAQLQEGLVGADRWYWLVVGDSFGLATKDIVLETLTEGTPDEVVECLMFCPGEAIDWRSGLEPIREQSRSVAPERSGLILELTLELLKKEDFQE